jgi:hypothetical protein
VIAVFGGASARAGEELYAQAEVLGRGLAAAGYAVATGGYGGTMEAVSKGAAEAGGWVIGVTCDRIERWRAVRPNAWVRERIHCDSLRERAYRLIDVASGLIALPGGLGTLSEITLALSWMQTGEVARRPLWVIGPTWSSLLDGFFERSTGLTRPEDRLLVRFARDVEGALVGLSDGGPPTGLAKGIGNG